MSNGSTEDQLERVQQKMLDDLEVNGILQELEIRGKKTRFRGGRDLQIINEMIDKASGRYLPARNHARLSK